MLSLLSLRYHTRLRKAAQVIQQGGIVAYPTEGVFGLGCDPFNLEAVQRLLQLKERTPDKGFILIAASFDQIESLIDRLPPDRLNTVLATWPGPVTWLFPASSRAPRLITGSHRSIAIRITAHPLARLLCQTARMPLISTSANVSGSPALRNADAVHQHFKNGVDYILAGTLGHLTKPTPIYDAQTGQQVRAGEER